MQVNMTLELLIERTDGEPVTADDADAMRAAVAKAIEQQLIGEGFSPDHLCIDKWRIVAAK